MFRRARDPLSRLACVYDGDRIIEELDGDGNMTAGYVFGPYVDEVLAMRRDVDPESPGLETFYYLHDYQFNVIALTDAAGNVVERYEYGDFGDPTIFDASGDPMGGTSAAQVET